MEWFKHSTGSHDDPDLSDAWDKFGDSGVVIFWVILELYGTEFSSLTNGGQMNVSIRFLERKLRRRWSAVAPKLEWYQSRGRIYFEVDEDRVKIKIPKFLELASNWTRRIKEPTEAPTEIPTELPAAKNRREEKKSRKEKEYTASFLAFYEAYPKKRGQPNAFVVWKKKQPPLEIVLEAIEKQKAWRADALPEEFRPEWKDPERWLKGEHWLDDVTSESSRMEDWATRRMREQNESH